MSFTSKIICTLLLFFITSTTFANPGEVDPNEVAQSALLNPAPIGDYLIPILIIGLVTAFFLLRKKKDKKKYW